MLLTNHSPHHDAEKLTALLKQNFPKNPKPMHDAVFEPPNMEIRSATGAFPPVDCGTFLRFETTCDE